MPIMIQKRFPADVNLEQDTFLNNNSIDGELYSIYQSLSTSYRKEDGTYETIVEKKKIPKQVDLCKKLNIKCTKTIKAHHKELVNRGYVIVDDKGNYILPPAEDIYMLIPLETLQYLNDTCRQHVIKTYIYLGQRYKQYGAGYQFTLLEIGNHIGINIKNRSAGYQMINNALDLLYNSGLIDYCSYFDNGLVMQKKKLLDFSFQYKKNSK